MNRADERVAEMARKGITVTLNRTNAFGTIVSGERNIGGRIVGVDRLIETRDLMGASYPDQILLLKLDEIERALERVDG